VGGSLSLLSFFGLWSIGMFIAPVALLEISAALCLTMSAAAGRREA